MTQISQSVLLTFFLFASFWSAMFLLICVICVICGRISCGQNKTFVFQTRCTEVQQKPALHSCGLQVVDDLRFLLAAEPIKRL